MPQLPRALDATNAMWNNVAWNGLLIRLRLVITAFDFLIFVRQLLGKDFQYGQNRFTISFRNLEQHFFYFFGLICRPSASFDQEAFNITFEEVGQLIEFVNARTDQS